MILSSTTGTTSVQSSRVFGTLVFVGVSLMVIFLVGVAALMVVIRKGRKPRVESPPEYSPVFPDSSVSLMPTRTIPYAASEPSSTESNV